MLAGELVYTGVERSPVCAVVGQVPYRGQTCAVAQELFATMRDVYLVLGKLTEQPENLQTADGRPSTRTAAVARLARMICADETEFDEQDAVEMAAAAAEAQAELVCAALSRVTRRGECCPATPDAALSQPNSFNRDPTGSAWLVQAPLRALPDGSRLNEPKMRTARAPYKRRLEPPCHRVGPWGFPGTAGLEQIRPQRAGHFAGRAARTRGLPCCPSVRPGGTAARGIRR